MFFNSISTSSLERNIVVKKKFLKNLEEEVMLKKQQLKKITNQYKDFIQKTVKKRRRRQGLLL